MHILDLLKKKMFFFLVVFGNSVEALKQALYICEHKRALFITSPFYACNRRRPIMNYDGTINIVTVPTGQEHGPWAQHVMICFKDVCTVNIFLYPLVFILHHILMIVNLNY